MQFVGKTIVLTCRAEGRFHFETSLRILKGANCDFPQRYRPEAGTAIVFSSSLLHEAMHVTAGRRFVFLAFLFGDT